MKVEKGVALFNIDNDVDLFRNILENHTEGVVITSSKGVIQWVNKEFQKITGYSLEEAAGSGASILKSGKQDREFYNKMWKSLAETGKWSGQIWNRDKDGNIYFEWLSIYSVTNQEDVVTHYVGIFRDLSEKKEIVRAINNLQRKDSLTGLYNGNYFLQFIKDNIERCENSNRGFAVIMIKIKEFSQINNSLGQSVGDEILKESANRMLKYITKNHLLARFRGAEFLILCEQCENLDDVVRYGQILMNDLLLPYVIDDSIVHINYNISISRYPEDGTDVNAIIQCADIAMNIAREKGIELPVVYDPIMAKEIDQRFLISNQLVDAIEKNELSIFYQPIFSMKDPSNIVAAEALLRWDNSILGRVSPDIFIAIAEKIGQINIIGEWVLRQVCKQIKEWEKAGKNLIPISVNVSVKQLEVEDFAKRLIFILEEYKIPTFLIDLEITESVSSGNLEVIVGNLKELKKYGFKMSMDDFGTGFSSLGQLELFELDKLKIDKIFIDDVVNVSKRQNLVKAIIAMAHSLNLLVIAEGIETKEQVEFMNTLGCQMGQGYYVSKPLPVEEFTELLKIRE